MRTLLVITWIILRTSSTQAQDQTATAQPTAPAAQQAMPDMQQAPGQGSQGTADAWQPQAYPTCCYIVKPTFSLKPGKYNGVTTVKIRDTTRGAVIYYTTDGWTPTALSKRYTGPVTIDSTTTLQAVAIGPVPSRSLVASAKYTISGSSSLAQAHLETTIAPSFNSTGQPLLPRGMAVPLIFVSDISSQTADVGDKIQLSVSEDIKAGEVSLIKKGTPAVATVTEAYKSAPGGAPGSIAFEVDSLLAEGLVVRLHGSQMLEGEAKLPNATTLIPVVGIFTVFRHGQAAEIKTGTALTAYVDVDTVLAPVQQPNLPAN